MLTFLLIFYNKLQTRMFPLQEKVIKCDHQQYELLLNQRSINDKVIQMAEQINNFYKELLINQKDQHVIGLCILKGGFMYFTDLVKKLKFYLQPEFAYDKRIYKNLQGEQKVKIKGIKNKHVLVVMNYIDKIQNISQIYELLNNLGAKTINFTVLISGNAQQLKVACKWIGFSYSFSAEFIGYGFAKDQYYRPLNQIYKKCQNYVEAQNTIKKQNPQEF